MEIAGFKIVDFNSFVFFVDVNVIDFSSDRNAIVG